MKKKLRFAAAQARRDPLRGAVVGAMLSLSALAAPAATIVGGSDLLNAGSAAQLETWLGQGPLTLTNIFDKVDGNTSVDFHAAADGQGARFSIIEVTGFQGRPFDVPVIVGSYNPRSWNSIGDYNYSPTNAERTAFLFNLNQGLKFAQQQGAGTTNRGQFQTYNHSSYGPTFGGGNDLYVSHSLSEGHSFLYSYATDDQIGLDLARYPQPYSGAMQFGQIEVFTVAAIPEPETWALMLAGLAGLALSAKARARRN